MIREKPFPVRRGSMTKREWGELILRLWGEDGYPELIGPPAEQVHLARQLTGWDDQRKPAQKKGKQ